MSFKCISNAAAWRVACTESRAPGHDLFDRSAALCPPSGICIPPPLTYVCTKFVLLPGCVLTLITRQPAPSRSSPRYFDASTAIDRAPHRGTPRKRRGFYRAALYHALINCAIVFLKRSFFIRPTKHELLRGLI